MQNPQLQTLIDAIKFQQNLATWYLHFLKEQDCHKIFEVEGIKLNSINWLVGHMAWSDNDLILKATHGKEFDNPYLNNFAIGAPQEFNHTFDFKELKEINKEVHQLAIEHLESLSDSDLSKQNAYNEGFGSEPTYKTVIMHYLRHSGVHIGHLSWLCKLFNIKTV